MIEVNLCCLNGRVEFKYLAKLRTQIVIPVYVFKSTCYTPREVKGYSWPPHNREISGN